MSVARRKARIAGEISRGLRIHLRGAGFRLRHDGTVAPRDRTKDGYRGLHQAQRLEKLGREQSFIEQKWPVLRIHLADGSDINPGRILPRLELIKADTWQSDLFRLASLTWSVPVSQGYGRRMRFLVWDVHNDKLIGILALGDPVFNLRARDNYIGWSLRYRRSRLVNILDAYVVGAVPPYNALLGGKLVACLMKTREVKNAFRERYAKRYGLISKRRKNASLVMVTTTSSLGRSSIFDRLKLQGETYLESVGYTDGWGHFHVPDGLFGLMRQYLALCGHRYAEGHRFGDGPNWKLRTVRQALVMLGINDDVLNHGIGREVFVGLLARNARELLRGRNLSRPDYHGLRSVEEVGELARERWLVPRADRRPEYRDWTKTDTAALLSFSDGFFLSDVGVPSPGVSASDDSC